MEIVVLTGVIDVMLYNNLIIIIIITLYDIIWLGERRASWTQNDGGGNVESSYK